MWSGSCTAVTFFSLFTFMVLFKALLPCFISYYTCKVLMAVQVYIIYKSSPRWFINRNIAHCRKGQWEKERVILYGMSENNRKKCWYQAVFQPWATALCWQWRHDCEQIFSKQTLYESVLITNNQVFIMAVLSCKFTRCSFNAVRLYTPDYEQWVERGDDSRLLSLK